MASKEEVKSFLEGFKLKLSIWEVLFLNRRKNLQSLLDLEIRPMDRQRILERLEWKDFSQGPLEEKMMNGAEMWVFGKSIKGKEVYIKITMGEPGASVLCISFHIAEHPMDYAFKEN